MVAYADLEIRILELAAEGYPVEITFNHEQEFERGYLKPDILPWLASTSAAADGERLFNRLLADDRLRTAWAEVRGQRPQRRIRLWLDATAPELHALPWELLRDAGPGLTPQTLAADTDTPFSRYLAGRWRHGSPLADRPIKLLVALANPANLADYGLAPLDIGTERQLITQAVSDLGHDQLELTFLEPPLTLAALDAELRRGFHLLHLVGHGRFHQQRGQAVLFLANNDNRVERVSEADLAELLARQEESLRLVFLAACQTATRNPADAFRGFAPQLIAAGVPAVIAMQDVVPLDAAREFTHTFYRQLLQHGQVDLAANEGRSALLAAGWADSWAVPALTSRLPDGIILAPQPPRLERVRRLPMVAKTLAIGGGLLAVVSVVAMMLGLVVDLWTIIPTPTPTQVMPDNGFNIAVAQFTTLGDDTDSPDSFQASQDLSAWIFKGIDDQSKETTELNANVWGPERVGIIQGEDRDTRAANARSFANDYKANLMIYGVITSSNNSYYVQPEFYVSHDGFDYGSEVIGPDRLGQPVTFTLPLENQGITNELKDRREVLQHVVVGLGYYYVKDYKNAWAEFYQASTLERDQGKEVIYLLMGAANLRIYDQIKSDRQRRNEILDQAFKEFSIANENSNYVRSYLGLGAVSLQQATILNEDGTDIEFIDTGKLIKAEAWYSKTLKAPNQPDLVITKAAYGLGQIHLVAYEFGLSDRSRNEAERFLSQVISAENLDNNEELMWFIGHAQALHCRLDGLDANWLAMSTGCREAITILGRLPRKSTSDWFQIAHYWVWVACAEIKLNRLDEARTAYDEAIQVGQDFVTPGELERWRNARDNLKEGASCRE